MLFFLEQLPAIMENEVDKGAYSPLNVGNIASEHFSSETLVILCFIFFIRSWFQNIFVEKKEKKVLTHFS